MKKILYLIFVVLKLIDDFFVKITKKSFLLKFNDFINNHFYLSLQINKKYTKFFIPNSTTKWRVDSLYDKEPETIEWIDGFTNKRNSKIIFWDIGSNIGLYSLYAAQKHKNIKVYSFEPSTSNLRILSRNISINNLVNKVLVCQLPLSDKNFSHLTMNEPEFIEGWSMNSYGKPINYEGKKFNATQRYKILGTSIDSLVSNNILEIPNYIKIDVDGIEDEILKGAKKTLKSKKVKSISIEINENFRSQHKSIIQILEKLRFSFKHKKHAEIYNKSKKFNKMYNYVFL
jgi:FkbM family methyltransferase